MFPQLLVVFLVFGAVSSESCVANISRCDQNALFYITSSSVVGMTLTSAVPSILSSSPYLAPTSCLGYLGPIGPYGPLGSLGPLGSNTWNPSYWITGSGFDWSDWAKNMSGEGGPLSSKGPLGETGPLSAHAYYKVCPCINPFSHHLMLGGVFSALGPLGPLGALGPLGPLGPIGAHGYASNSRGDYIENKTGTIKRTYACPYNTSLTRKFDLFEFYSDAEYVKSKQDNDVSFMVNNYVTYSNSDTFKFTAKEPQYVTILLVPLKQLDVFSLDIMTFSSTSKKQKIHVNSLAYVNWAVIKVTPNTQFMVTVNLENTGHFLKSDYNLYVTGSSSYFQLTDIKGDHQKFF